MCDECEIDCKCSCIWTHDMVDVGIANIQSGPDGCNYCQHIKKEVDIEEIVKKAFRKSD